VLKVVGVEMAFICPLLGIGFTLVCIGGALDSGSTVMVGLVMIGIALLIIFGEGLKQTQMQ
jgi:hypothetical protein